LVGRPRDFGRRLGFWKQLGSLRLLGFVKAETNPYSHKCHPMEHLLFSTLYSGFICQGGKILSGKINFGKILPGKNSVPKLIRVGVKILSPRGLERVKRNFGAKHRRIFGSYF
jgi:hypothetical protein